MVKKFGLIVLGALFLSMGLACIQAQSTQVPEEPAKSQTEVVSKPAWQQEWEKTLAAAKEEGTVIVSTSAGPGQTAALRDGFTKAYGINVEYIVGNGADISAKLFAERRAGLYLADVYLSGPATELTIFKPAGVLDPIKPQLLLPEVLDTKVLYGGIPVLLDNEQTYVMAQSLFSFTQLVVNSDMVKPDEIRNNKDLLNPKWKGKMVMVDPSSQGASGRTWTAWAYLFLGADFLRQLAGQDLTILSDRRLAVESVARGKYPVLVGVPPQEVAEFIKLAAPIRQISTPDLSWAGSGMVPVLMNRAAHPNASRVFLNWLFSKEGQTVNSRAFLQQSLRLDVPTDHLDPMTVRQPGVNYINTEKEENVLKRDEAGDAGAAILLGAPVARR